MSNHTNTLNNNEHIEYNNEQVEYNNEQIEFNIYNDINNDLDTTTFSLLG